MDKSKTTPLQHSITPSLHAVEVAAGLIFRAGKLLITQRPVEGHLGGLWEFPGGKIERGETPEQGLGRELREELGVDVAVGRLLESVTHDYPEKRVCLQFFLCRLQRGEPKPLGCPALKWVAPSELKDHTFPAADAKLLNRLRRSPGFWRERP